MVNEPAIGQRSTRTQRARGLIRASSTSVEHGLQRWARERLSLEATDSDWMYGLIAFMGEERGLALLRKLAALKPEMRKGHILVAQLVAAGELPVCLTIYSGNAESIKAKGGPIDWSVVEPLIGRPQAIALAKNAPHPHAALLVADFRHSQQGRTVLGDKSWGH